jgi:uncharacterized protein (DUF1330 family)
MAKDNKSSKDISMQSFIDPTDEAGRRLFARDITGEVIMLNLLRFREIADYSATPELAPETPISGYQAYQRYMAHSSPFLRQSGGSVMLLGEGGSFFIGPPEERCDLVILVRHKSLSVFMEFASNQDYLAGMGHRTAALEDSRLLPIDEIR